MRSPGSGYNLGFRARLCALHKPAAPIYCLFTGANHGRPAKQKVAFQARYAPFTQRPHDTGHCHQPTTGEVHLRHHISPNGFYRGRQVLKSKSEA